MPGRDSLSAARRIVRRRRRPIAATFAGVGAILMLTTLRATPEPAVADAGDRPGSPVAPGEVIVPVVLASGAIAAVLSVGDVVDVLGFSDTTPPAPTVIAQEARVIGVPAGAGFAGSSSAVVLMAVPEPDAMSLSAASLGGGLTVILHGR
jgi:hypothetical protein